MFHKTIYLLAGKARGKPRASRWMGFVLPTQRNAGVFLWRASRRGGYRATNDTPDDDENDDQDDTAGGRACTAATTTAAGITAGVVRDVVDNKADNIHQESSDETR